MVDCVRSLEFSFFHVYYVVNHPETVTETRSNTRSKMLCLLICDHFLVRSFADCGT